MPNMDSLGDQNQLYTRKGLIAFAAALMTPLAVVVGTSFQGLLQLLNIFINPSDNNESGARGQPTAYAPSPAQQSHTEDHHKGFRALFVCLGIPGITSTLALMLCLHLISQDEKLDIKRILALRKIILHLTFFGMTFLVLIITPVLCVVLEGGDLNYWITAVVLCALIGVFCWAFSGGQFWTGDKYLSDRFKQILKKYMPLLVFFLYGAVAGLIFPFFTKDLGKDIKAPFANNK